MVAPLMIANQEYFSTYSTDLKCRIELANGKSTMCPGKGYIYVKTESGQPLKLGFSPCSSTIWKSHFPG
jgi:hypothetical protein